MRIVLLYPPPWKIPSAGEDPDQAGQGPPSLDAIIDDGAEMMMPYGLMSLAAQAKRGGHDVTLLNIYTFPWRDITELIRHLPADVYGLSCFTCNRRGTLSLSNLIRKTYPQAYIVVGGPHASALPQEMMEHSEAIDGIVIGEGEATFNELVQHIEHDKPIGNIAGMACRTEDGVAIGPRRKRISNLDSLASPFDYYKGHIVITSRGCPGNCTFCGSRDMWGRELFFHSAQYTADMIEQIVNIHHERSISIKDDTFTCNRKHVLQVCDEILKRNIRFLWSCDTRVDTLDEEVLYAMRRAGCQMISLGVESGSREVLKKISKGITPEKVLTVTNMAKKFGFRIRYYMMAGNRGETADTLQASLDFIAEAKPNEFLFSFLSIFPGTKEFQLAERTGIADREMFFTRDDRSFKYFFRDEESPKLRQIVDWIKEHMGTNDFWDYSIAERKRILRIFPDLAAAHMDLGRAYYQAGDLIGATRHIQSALNMDFALPSLAYNFLACIAARQGKLAQTLHHLEQAKRLGDYRIINENLESLRSWVLSGGMQTRKAPDLIADRGLYIGRLMQQPIFPSPITLPSSTALPNSQSAVLLPTAGPGVIS